MAVSAIPLTTGSDTTNGTLTYTTASITPTPGRLVLAAVLVTVSSGTTTVDLSGGGLTWVKVDQTTSAARTVHLFRAMGTPTAGPLTITGGSAMTSALWQVVEFNGTDTSGVDGSGAIVQSVSVRPSASTTASVSFPAAVSAANAAYAAVGVAVQEAPAPGGSGWLSLGTVTETGPTSGLLGEYVSPAAQDITASWASISASFVVGVELKAATGVATPTGAAGGSWSFAGSAEGTASRDGSASGTWTFIGEAVGGNAPGGAASGAWSFTQTAASGTAFHSGAASGAWSFQGSAAAGARPSVGVVSGTWSFAGTATGRSPGASVQSHTYGFATLASNGVSSSTPSPVAVIYTLPAAYPGASVFPGASLHPGGVGDDEGTVHGAATAALTGDGISTATLIPQLALATLQTT